jgi:4-oxalomesaconate hydratase
MQDKTRVLVVSAHAADFCSRAGGAVAKYVAAGAEVRVICLTFGEKGESPDLYQAMPNIPLSEVKGIRRAETEAAAAVLKVDVRFMDWEDHPLFIGEERFYRLVDEIRSWKPQILLTHWSHDQVNQDHQVTSAAVVRAAVDCGRAVGLRTDYPAIPWPNVFLFESTIPLTEFQLFNPDTYLDITSVFDAKVRALECFTSQKFLVPEYTDYAIRRAKQARYLSHDDKIKYAEGFKRFLPWVGQYFP